MDGKNIMIGLFVVTACFGIYLISHVLRDKKAPRNSMFIHGFFAASAISLLLIYTIKQGGSLFAPLIIFLLAAGGGGIMLWMDLTGQKVPKWLAIGHGLIAATGLAVLLVLVLT